MATGSFQLTIADTFDVSQQLVSNCTAKIVRAIASLLQDYVKRPSREHFSNIRNYYFEMSGFPGVLGAVDCTHVPIQSPGGARAEEFRCRKGFFSLNVQAACGPNLEFFDFVCRWPGSVHDSRIFNNSRLFFDLQHDLLEGHHLLGDSAYPLLPFLLTPVANPVGQREVRYNISHSKARNTIERAFGVLKMRFRCLTIPLKINLTTVMATICSAAVLHNMAVKYKEDLYMCNDDGEEESVNIEENIEQFVNAAGRQKRNNIINEYFS